VEYRPPDPSANPHLAFAAMLLAGQDGVLNQIDPGEPLDKNIYELPPEELKKVPNIKIQFARWEYVGFPGLHRPNFVDFLGEDR
jgi:hypothetical protein